MISLGESSDGPGTTPRDWPVREELILGHLPQVRLIARQVSDRLPVSVSLEDLISAGTVGLISAIDRFDPTQHVKLQTYAEYKIRGAILDSLRTMDWAPRQQRRRARMIETAIRELEQRLNRLPTEEEIAEGLGLSIKQYQEWLAATRNLAIGSLEVAGEDEGRRMLRYLVDSSETSPSQMLEQSELETLLRNAIDELPEVERTILNFYFYEEITLREIARILSLHESRISQLKTQAILRIRSAMQARWSYWSRSALSRTVTETSL